MVDVRKTLYSKIGTVESISTDIGVTGIVSLHDSKARAHVKASGAAKISSIACIFDLIYRYPGSICAYESTVEESIYAEVDGVQVIVRDGEIYFSKEPEKKQYLLVPLALYELSSYGSNAEFKELFEKITKEYATTGVVNKDDTFKLCDSFYYGCIFGKRDTLNDEYGIIDNAQLEAAFRAGTYKPLELLYAIPDSSKYIKTSDMASMSHKTKKAKKSSKGDNSFIQDCKDGVYKIPYEWPENMKKYIISKTFLDSFESTPEFEEIVRKIKYRATRILERMDMGLTGADAIGKDALNIMLLGKPGTGKTTLAYALSAATGMPVCTTAWNKHSDEDESEGKTKIVDGKPAFVETDALIFHENGGIDVNEEINLADPSVTMGCLGQKLEYPFIVKKNGYETVVRHPLNVVIATMNVGTNGSNPLNQALANRFKTPYILDDPTSETFISILMKASGKSREVCEYVYNAYEATTQYLKDPDVNEDEICQNLSIRTCLGAIENMDEGQTPVRALINSIVGAVAVVDIEVARNLQHEKIECLPNPSFDMEEEEEEAGKVKGKKVAA